MADYMATHPYHTLRNIDWSITQCNQSLSNNSLPAVFCESSVLLYPYTHIRGEQVRRIIWRASYGDANTRRPQRHRHLSMPTGRLVPARALRLRSDELGLPQLPGD